MDTQALVHQLRYSAWASERVIESAVALPHEELHRDLGNSFGSVYSTLVHIFQADAIWWDRLMGAPRSDVEPYAPPELVELSKKWLNLLHTYTRWAEKLTLSEWDRVVAYHSFAGKPYDTLVWQIVLHVVNHASYHRGQITTMLRQLGRTPVGTDLITYYRSL
jgi:uncharacterized damage-inducible protein DinB